MKRIYNSTSITCDNCGKFMQYDTVELSFGYLSNFDEKSFDFCSDKCLKDWINKNIKGPIKSSKKIGDKRFK